MTKESKNNERSWHMQEIGAGDYKEHLQMFEFVYQSFWLLNK